MTPAPDRTGGPDPAFATGAWPARQRAVLHWLRHHSALPLVAMELWAVLLDKVHAPTGDVLATRAELAAAVGTTPDDVSRLLSELEALGIAGRRREKVRGLRGPGRVVYRLADCVRPVAGEAR